MCSSDLDWQERDLDPAVMYSAGGGMPHGRLAIGDGAFRKSQVAAAAKKKQHKASKLYVLPRTVEEEPSLGKTREELF